MDAALLIVGILVVLLLALVAWRLARPAGPEAQRAERQLSDQMAALQASQQELVGRLGQLSDGHTAAQAALNKTLEERLEGVSKRLGDSLTHSSTQTANSLGELRKHLNVIDAAQKNIAELSSQVVGLQDILANKQARGAFGEVQLNDIVRAALPPSAYSFQATLANNRRADCLIKLPMPPGPIAIDAKFPLESYRALHEAGDEAAATAAARAFAADIRKHVQDIAERYIVPGETAESALMFLPSEAVYAELHANFPEVVEQSYRARVWIVSPTTLMATLNTVRAVLKDVRMREQAGVIQAEVAKMLDDVERLVKRVGNLKGHFAQAEKDIREIETSAGKVQRKGERIGELQFDEDGAEAPPDEIAPPGPRLVAD
jgi:DNA recombination protein RmuC